MRGDGDTGERYKIILYLLVAAVVILAIGASVRSYLDDSWLSVVEIAVTGVLSVALVLLYFRQTRILESQKNLLTQELNREARQQHTETLRERVRTWHGDPDGETRATIEGPDLNLPRVRPASFESAPTGSRPVPYSEEEEPFQVIPHQLAGDRYLEDLLQNHALDLRELAEEIVTLHDRFTTFRDEFVQEYEGKVVEKAEYTLQPDDYLARWIFEYVVMRERGFLEDQEGLIDRALSDLERGETSIWDEGSTIWVQPAIGGRSYRTIYGAALETDDREELQANRDNAKEDVTGIVEELLDEINDGYPFGLAHDAADTLDDAAIAVDELERTLIEYDGRPIYPGDCEYLQEARLS